MSIRSIIIDDDPLARKVIREYLDRVKGFEILGEYDNAMDVLEMVQSGGIDLIFLDIDLPVLNGLDFVRSLENPPSIVITTSYRDYAVECFEMDILDYLIKPIPFNRFLKSLNKALKVHKQNHPTEDSLGARGYFFVKVDKKMVKIFFDEILYIESVKDYVKIYTVNEELLIHYTLTSITEELPPDQFKRVHRSFTVSLDRVKAISGNQLEIEGQMIPIGRNYAQQIKELLLSDKNIQK